MIRILVVCLGNICRSPLAASVLQAELERGGLSGRIEVDSAGTYAGHQGEKADPRAVAVASARGYEQIHRERARRVSSKDFAGFDLLLAMDRDNLANPYYGNAAGFERVMVLCEAGARGVVRRLATVSD
jgi:protein-tyrosine phosphatase